jgi:hypothetical protein
MFIANVSPLKNRSPYCNREALTGNPERPKSGAVLAAGCLVAALGALVGAEENYPTGFRAAIEADWAAQEERLGRTPADPEAVRKTLERAWRLLDGLDRRLPGQIDRQHWTAELDRVAVEAEAVGSLDEADRARLYRRLRWTIRSLVLQHPELNGPPLLFMKRQRFLCQMLHEYLGYYGDYGDVAGGGVFVLPHPGHSFEVQDLIGDRLPRGNYTTLALSYDARRVYFAFADRAATKPDYYAPDRRSFHLFSVNADGNYLQQLTFGPDDDFDPCPLPDGDIAFMSTRRGGFGRCHGAWEPLPTYTLHRMDPTGQRVRTLSFHETNEWHPSVLHDGRIVYIRWDYVDRSAAHHHGLWATRPDGSASSVLWGNYTQRLNACYQPRAVPGSNKILFVAGAHHAAVGGSLVLFDPDRAALDPSSGEDRFESLEVLTPEVCFPEVPYEAPQWPGSYFHSPWPLSEDFYLVAFSFHPLPGMGPRVNDEPGTGLYYFDRFGNLELLYREEGISSMYPIPLVPRKVPPVLPNLLEPPSDELADQEATRDQGEFILADVRRSLMPLPDDRPIRSLRIFQILPKTETHVANQPRIGYANAESARMLLGSVPVEADGSAWFKIPAGKPVYFQAVDEHGRGVQTMRSLTYVQAGERQSCVGCHEPVGTAPPPRELAALVRGPSAIEPGPDGTRPISFPRLVQPVLDRHCIACHDGSQQPGKAHPSLLAVPAGPFTQAYENLRPHVRWYEWGSGSIGQIVTHPGRSGSDASPLLDILDDANHAGQVRLGEQDRMRLTIWLDSNVPFYGVYAPQAQQSQRAGLSIPPPRVQ